MDSSLMMILMAIVIFVVTFAFGYLPTKIKTSQKIMNLIAIFGAGLLIGAALIVIIPEGISVLYSSVVPPAPTSSA